MADDSVRHINAFIGDEAQHVGQYHKQVPDCTSQPTGTEHNNMSQFKVGDKVKIISLSADVNQSKLGLTGTIVRDNHAGFGRYQLDTPGIEEWSFKDNNLQLIKEKNSMTKYYRVIKDHPAYELNAILTNEADGTAYSAISDVFVREITGVQPGWLEGAELVENQPEWFERIYPIGKLNKMLFGDKKQAQAAAAAMYQGE
jgi:hypothetical protein